MIRNFNPVVRLDIGSWSMRMSGVLLLVAAPVIAVITAKMLNDGFVELLKDYAADSLYMIVYGDFPDLV